MSCCSPIPRVTTALLAFALVLVAGLAGAAHLKDFPKKHRIVYQLIDPGSDKARLVLRNIEQHVAGVGGWQNIEALELVVHGPALQSFTADRIDPGIKRALEMLQTQGLQFGACGNTMRNFNIALEQLPDGAKVLPQGGVVRIMELQEAGYIYLRP
jgi:intracellular sulfur oxidation DsrE/DsrF family protein